MDTLSYVVACNILKLRAKAGLSRLALASEAGIGQDTLHDIEHACINSSVRTIDKIADALGVPSYQLFAGVVSASFQGRAAHRIFAQGSVTLTFAFSPALSLHRLRHASCPEFP